ncbi:hypothetical protein SPI_01311 [Niveomyces insectorum RCEF 264]|uniref:Uncharacterized protein n=1 Tax=Niveomyces insectorum RCEF 264 TaxID=1081102 RepID=A0A167YVB3_9HYPO|nr:hypothetical protein SPI_01311 [Niveomyces insectorum RCEF 264]
MASTPRINLRRAASYTHERGPLSSTSSRFSFNHLVFSSPPPSPGLPQPQRLPRRRKPSGTPRPSRVLRAVIYLAGLVSLSYWALSTLWSKSNVNTAAGAGLYFWPTQPRAHDDSYDMVGQSTLPNHPTPVIVSDSHGNPKWTVSIPPNYHFPLAADDYVDICAKCTEVANRLETLRAYETSSTGLGALGGSKSSSRGRGRGSSSGSGRETKRGKKQGLLHHGSRGKGKRSRAESKFVDVHEAEMAGFLPGSVSIATLMSQHAGDDELVGENQNSLVGRPVCAKSMTFVLASADAGLGRTLMLLWMAYAQAESEGRGFFIDDTRWAYGKYADMFAPPPSPNCRPPLRHEMLPCPRHARHLVVTMDTAREVFASELGNDDDDEEDVEDDNTTGMAAANEAAAAHTFSLVRRGYEALFRLGDDDAEYVSRRVKELKAKALSETPGQGEPLNSKKAAQGTRDGTIVGLHVRRGDRRPIEFQYRDSYIPLNLYADRAHDLIEAQHAGAGAKDHRRGGSPADDGRPQSGHSFMVLASDDPMVYDADEFAGAARAQERIRLASKAVTKPREPDPGAFHKFVDETFGWEGGFFAAMFWTLGRPSHHHHDHAAASGASAGAAGAALGNGGQTHGRKHGTAMSMLEAAAQTPPSAETLRIRSLVGRAYAMDLAVLAQASDAVVCAVSATGCRLLAVMLGWEAAIQQGRWVNLDGDYGWWAVDL